MGSPNPVPAMAGVGAMKTKFEDNLGKLHYRINYEEASQNLSITVVECKELKKMDILGKSDPFVRIYLMPGNHKELKTKVIKKNLNPLFNQVFNWDKVSKTDGIGEVQVPLWQLNLSSPTDEWKNLHKLTGTKDKPVLHHSARTSTSSMPRSSSQPSLPPTSPPRRTRSSSSSDDEKKTPGPPPPAGVPALKYHVSYEHAQKTLILTVAEGKNLKKA